MFRPCEYADKSPEHHLEAALRVLGRKFRNRWLFSYNERQFRHKVHNQQTVRIQRLAKRIAPVEQLGLALAQKRTDQALKGLR